MEQAIRMDEMPLHAAGSVRSAPEVARWRAAYADALAQPECQEAQNQHLVQLQTWPNLSRLPPELVAPASRICALLWRKPTVSFLVPHVLKTPKHETCALLHVLQAMGHVTALRTDGNSVRGALEAQEEAASLVNPERSRNSLFGKLWLRLVRT